MRAVDTNVLVRLIARDDPAQVAATIEGGGRFREHAP
jgi:predicted nucleic-acid-binding protein